MKKFGGAKTFFSNLRGGDKAPKPENDVQETLAECDFVFSKVSSTISNVPVMHIIL